MRDRPNNTRLIRSIISVVPPNNAATQPDCFFRLSSGALQAHLRALASLTGPTYLAITKTDQPAVNYTRLHQPCLTRSLILLAPRQNPPLPRPNLLEIA